VDFTAYSPHADAGLGGVTIWTVDMSLDQNWSLGDLAFASAGRPNSLTVFFEVRFRN
jgi:hypothetical protein